MFFAPFLQGLYFEKDQYPAEIFVFIIFGIFWIYKMVKKSKLTLSNPLEYAAFGFWQSILYPYLLLQVPEQQ